MKRKILVVSLIGSIFLLFLPTNVWSAKPRPNRSRKSTTTSRISSNGARSSVKFRPDRKALLINFLDFGSAVSVTYTLTYTADGIPQGAMGTATPETASQQREVLFGTCSKGVCHYHTNITNARLVIDSKLKSGLTVRKPYRIKI